MRWLGGIAFAVMHVACSSSPSVPDAITADAMTGGLIIELVASGGVPQMPTPSVEITKVVIGMRSLRAIGDAAPGDVRTTRTDLELEWRDNLMPVPHLFPAAPPGVYSTIELQVGDSAKSSAAVDVVGRVVRAGMLVPFEINSTVADVAISVPITTDLAPRTFVTAAVDVDVAALVTGIDWEALPLTGDGRIYLGDGDPALAGVIAKLASAFTSRN